MPGKVILVGAGPGDPDLITVKGLNAIMSAECIVYDYLASPKLLKYASPEAELIYAGKRGGRRSRPQEEINDLLLTKADAGKLVVRLKGGDPYVFGRGGEEVTALHDAGIPFEVIPGIPAALGMAAYAGVPLTDRRHASQVTFVTGHEDPHKPENRVKWEALAKLPGTLVIYMGCCNVERSTSALIHFGKSADTPASITRWATTGKQQTVTATLATLAAETIKAGLTAPATIVIGTVNDCRPAAAWFERLPLFGKRIMVTRSYSKTSALSDGLTALGTDVVEVPVIAIEPIPDNEPLLSAVRKLSSYSWVVFTSANGVSACMTALAEVSLDVRAFGSCKIATVGKATAAKLGEFGLISDMTPNHSTGRDVFEALAQTGDLAKQSILMPRSEIAHADLRDLCLNAGATVNDVPAYRTVSVAFDADDVRKQLSEGTLDGITFTSSSTVKNFIDGVGSDFLGTVRDRVVPLSIGPTTSATLREYGLVPSAEAVTSNVDGLLKAIVDHFTCIDE